MDLSKNTNSGTTAKNATPRIFLFGGLILALLTFHLFSSTAEGLPTMQTAVLQFATGDITRTEPASDEQQTVTVTLNQAITDNTVITVEYQTVDGTATAGQDYTSATGVLTFTQSTNTTQSFNVTILDDSLEEARESFSVVLKNPTNATLGAIPTFVIVIESNDPQPTATATANSGATATPVFIDAYEGNDALQTAFSLDTVFPTGCAIDDATLWPAGDIDFYRFWAQAGIPYTISTSEVSDGLDTAMTLYNPEGQRITTSAPQGNKDSLVQYTPSVDAWHYISIVNEDPSNPAGKTYCVKFTLTNPTATPTPTPTFALSAAHDACRTELQFPDNDQPAYACLLELTSADAGSAVQRNFVPRAEGVTDIDYYRVWVREGNFYTCTTSELSEFNDTRMKFLNPDQAVLVENDNASPLTAGSEASYLATYTGWMYILVEPVVGVEYRIADRYVYQLACTAELTTPTPTPRPTQAQVNNGGARSTSTPTPTSTAEAQPQETIDVLATVQAASTPTPPPTARPNISINPVPTNPPVMTPSFSANLQVVLFYDRNQNNLPEIDEGIVDMAVLAKDSATGELLALGYTNDAGIIRFELQPSSQTINIMIPYLNIDQTVSTNSNDLLIKVASSTLPSSLP